MSQGQHQSTPVIREIHPRGGQLGWGILRNFALSIPASLLTPTVTSGQILLPNGEVKTLITANFATIGPASDGNVTVSDDTFVFYNVVTDAAYSNLTGAKTNETDILLGVITADGTDITGVRTGEWYDAVAVLAARAGALDGGAGTDLGGVVYKGPPRYCYGAGMVILTSVSAGAGTNTCTFARKKIGQTAATLVSYEYGASITADID